MTKVNLPPIKPPDKWLGDPELSRGVQELYFVIYQLYQRSGGGTDISDDLQIQITENAGDIDDLENEVFTLYSLAANRTTDGNEIVIANGYDVTLNATPANRERVYVKIGADTTVTISGNGKTIDGDTSINRFIAYQCLLMVYSQPTDEWLII